MKWIVEVCEDTLCNTWILLNFIAVVYDRNNFDFIMSGVKIMQLLNECRQIIIIAGKQICSYEKKV